MITLLEIECQECSATFHLKHDLNTSRYLIQWCPFCGGTSIELEEDYDEDDEGWY